MEDIIKKHILKIILGCLISLILIYLCIRNIDFKQSLSLIKNADISLIFIGVFFYVLSYLVRSIRWEYILAPLKKIKPFKSFFFLIFGFFMNNILPLRLGEIVRALVAGEKLQISRSGVFATVIVERLMDVIIFIICFFLIAVFVEIPFWLKKSFLLCALIFGIMFIVLFFMSRQEEKFLNLILKIKLPLKISNFITKLFIKFASGLKFFQNTKLIFYVFITSVIVWYIEAWAYKMLFMSFGVDVSIVQCLFVIVVTGIGAILPTAPAFVGAIEFMGIVALGVFGIEKSVAFTAIAATHFIEIMVVYALGFLGIIKEKISFSDLFNFAVSQQKEEEGELNEK